jgi:hypothetical protein
MSGSKDKEVSGTLDVDVGAEETVVSTSESEM